MWAVSDVVMDGGFGCFITSLGSGTSEKGCALRFLESYLRDSEMCARKLTPNVLRTPKCLTTMVWAGYTVECLKICPKHIAQH